MLSMDSPSHLRLNCGVRHQGCRGEVIVPDVTLDQVLPVVRNLAKRKANAFVRRCQIVNDEREDVQSQLVLTFIARWPNFDSQRASVGTFAARIMDRELISILRHRLAQSRRPCELPAQDTGP